MSTALRQPAEPLSLADVLVRLGGVSPRRIRMRPPPGRATEKDVLAIHDKEGRIYELVDGILVEKIMAYRESIIASLLCHYLLEFVLRRKLGVVTGEAGMVKLFPGLKRLIRIPDVAFASWDRLPGRRIPRDRVPDVVPDLVVEVLSKGNTTGEMRRKLREYFEAGVRLAWLVDIDQRVVRVHGGPDTFTEVGERQILKGDSVLPGFRLPLRKLFAKLDELETQGS